MRLHPDADGRPPRRRGRTHGPRRALGRLGAHTAHGCDAARQEARRFGLWAHWPRIGRHGARHADGNPLPKQYQPRVFIQEGSEAVDITETKLPANGSKGKISFEVRENSYGTFAKLRNVLVTDLIEYKKSSADGASDFGLEVQGASDFAETSNEEVASTKVSSKEEQTDTDGDIPF